MRQRLEKLERIAAQRLDLQPKAQGFNPDLFSEEELQFLNETSAKVKQREDGTCDFSDIDTDSLLRVERLLERNASSCRRTTK